ncbi:DUF5133 domain-containing protein [Streptomyces sp. NPDC029674]|uniref:DUF5133 domain-containing protein n=1 Tax=Streptomyces sp. NPDC029674 TaxID=3365297 RepID=UPI00384B2C68
MLMAHLVLKNLVEEYEALRVLHAETGSRATRERMEDVAYSLCASTGTRSVDAALAVARFRLRGVTTAEEKPVLAA